MRLLVKAAATVALAIALWALPAFAQVPPHYPGTICFTQTFWCWAPAAGPPGYACACPVQSPGGWMWYPGVLG